MSRFYATNSDFYSEIHELTQILLRISEEKIGDWGFWLYVRVYDNYEQLVRWEKINVPPLHVLIIMLLLELFDEESLMTR